MTHQYEQSSEGGGEKKGSAPAVTVTRTRMPRGPQVEGVTPANW